MQGCYPNFFIKLSLCYIPAVAKVREKWGCKNVPLRLQGQNEFSTSLLNVACIHSFDYYFFSEFFLLTLHSLTQR